MVNERSKQNPGNEDERLEELIRQRMEQMVADVQAGKFIVDRDSILGRLGYDSYASYRLGSLWRRTRSRILKRDGDCVRCDEKATQVHHLTYTEEVLRGEDDSQLASLCANCHHTVEFDEDGNWRGEPEKRRVLCDREGARKESEIAKQVRIRRQQLEEQTREASGGRCFWCKGDARHKWWPNDGRVYTIPTDAGVKINVWLCSGCSGRLDHDGRGRLRNDGAKVRLLERQAAVKYTRPDPSAGLRFGKVFWRLNALQREGIVNEFQWNVASRHRGTIDPVEFEMLRARFESTSANGRDRSSGTRP